jgi:hypothetical protein
MNTWIYKMVAWHRRFAVAAERLKQAPPQDLGRVYWDRRARRWGLGRQRSYLLVEVRRPASEVRSRPK